MARIIDGPAVPVGTRKSVPLTPEDVRDLALLRNESSPLGQSFAELAGESVWVSDAAVLHGLLTLGLQQVRDAAEAAGYLALADSYRTDSGEQAERAASRRHRVRGARARADDE